MSALLQHARPRRLKCDSLCVAGKGSALLQQYQPNRPESRLRAPQTPRLWVCRRQRRDVLSALLQLLGLRCGQLYGEHVFKHPLKRLRVGGLFCAGLPPWLCTTELTWMTAGSRVSRLLLRSLALTVFSPSAVVRRLLLLLLPNGPRGSSEAFPSCYLRFVM